MRPLWFLKLALKCIDLLSWPLFAFGYPLCASIRAIARDSHSETRNLISYWILLSLIYLFEYAFQKLLQWFHYWLHVKLMIIIWLVIPDFESASCAYNRLVHLYISMNPQAVISRFRNLKKLLVNKENFLLQAEKYITENGIEALEKLIASQTNKVRLHSEHKEIKDLEMTEKEDLPEGKQGNTAATNPELNENISSATVETEGTAGKHIAVGECLESCASRRVQKEWTSAMCQVTTRSKNNLKSHFHECGSSTFVRGKSRVNLAPQPSDRQLQPLDHCQVEADIVAIKLCETFH